MARERAALGDRCGRGVLGGCRLVPRSQSFVRHRPADAGPRPARPRSECVDFAPNCSLGAQVGQYKSVSAAIAGVAGPAADWRGFYAGLGVTCLRELPFAFIQFPLYESLKRLVTAGNADGDKVTPRQAAACGSLAGAVAAALTTPLDVIKTQLMLGHGQARRAIREQPQSHRIALRRSRYTRARHCRRGAAPSASFSSCLGRRTPRAGRARSSRGCGRASAG